MTDVKACAETAPRSEFPEIPGYRVLRLVGAGGMGSVYEAEKLATRECFAVKVVTTHMGADPGRVLRFQREVKALRNIRHPNVVEIYDWCLPPRGSAQRPYIVMELLHGETLADLLRREKVLPPARAVALMLQMLDGLAQAHRAGVLHRDLGPSNVFLVRRPEGRLRVKLLDFGLARPILDDDSGGSLTQPGTFLGKPAYASPEVFLERPLGPPSDVFSAGMVLYRMLTGRLPHAAVSGEMLWVERFSDRRSPVEYPSPRGFVPRLPEGLAEVVSRAVRKQVGERIATAKEFQRLLLAVEMTLADEASTAALQRIVQAADEDSVSGAGPTASALEQLAAASPRGSWLGFLAGGLAAAALAATVLFVVGAFSGTSEDGRDPGPTAAGEPEEWPPFEPDAGPTPDPAASAGTTASPTLVAPAPPVATEASTLPAETAAADVTAVPTVRIRLEGLPRGAVARVGEWEANAEGTAVVPLSDRPLDVNVEVPGGDYRLFAGTVVPDRDRSIRPALRRAGAGRAAHEGRRTGSEEPRTLEGAAGGVFVVSYD
ncbi:MAG: serine/threonine protein kinase [Deltaproteobacteria bacterium]|nr:serine/threonine protein kinase [Deltaproteobacteria bacterium]